MLRPAELTVNNSHPQRLPQLQGLCLVLRDCCGVGLAEDPGDAVVLDYLYRLKPSYVWFHRERRMRHAIPIPDECGHIYLMSTMG